MAGKNTAVFGVYGSHAEAERAVSALQSAGFRSTDISVLFPENEGTKDFAHEKGTKAPEGAATGAGTGAALGGALGWLTGIGALAIPGLGPFIAAGPIMAALAGAGVGGTLGGLTGALIGMGIPEYEAKRYEGRVKNGGILLSVHSDGGDWTDRAKKILESTGAQDIASASEKKGDFENTDKPMPRSGSTSDATRREGIRETGREFERDPDREVVVARAETMDDVSSDTSTRITPSPDDYPKR
jgi:hypothetical protein